MSAFAAVTTSADAGSLVRVAVDPDPGAGTSDEAGGVGTIC
jgi:hypothetical protein